MDFDTRFETAAGSIGNCSAFSWKCTENISAGIGIREKWIGKISFSLSVHKNGGCGKKLKKVIEKNDIVYRPAENGCYYPDLGLPEGSITT